MGGLLFPSYKVNYGIRDQFGEQKVDQIGILDRIGSVSIAERLQNGGMAVVSATSAAVTNIKIKNIYFSYTLLNPPNAGDQFLITAEIGSSLVYARFLPLVEDYSAEFTFDLTDTVLRTGELIRITLTSNAAPAATTDVVMTVTGIIF